MSFDWFKFSPSQYKMGRIQRQSAQAKADFIDLLCVYWTKQGNVTYEDSRFDCPSIDTLIQGGIVKRENDQIFIDFMDEQLDTTQKISKTRSIAGKSGANAKQMLANAKQTQADKTRLDKTRTEQTRTDGDRFEIFWDGYGKKNDRKKCESAWKNLSEAKKTKAIEYLPTYKRLTPNLKFRKNPLTYLHSETWNDEPIAVSNQYGSILQPL